MSQYYNYLENNEKLFLTIVNEWIIERSCNCGKMYVDICEKQT